MPAYSLRRLLWAGPIATLAAMLVDLLYYGVTKDLGERYLMPLKANGSLTSPLTAGMLVITILVPGLLATIFFGLLVRFARKPATVFLSVCVAALLLSIGGPFYLPAASLQTRILLGGMHVLSAVIITGGILHLSHKNAKVP
jgi:hypothetical protein